MNAWAAARDGTPAASFPLQRSVTAYQGQDEMVRHRWKVTGNCCAENDADVHGSGISGGDMCRRHCLTGEGDKNEDGRIRCIRGNVKQFTQALR